MSTNFTKAAFLGLATAALTVLPMTSSAATLTEVGSSTPFAISQPSLVLTPYVRVGGIFDKLGGIRPC
jgi:hypothetical protein